MAEQQLSLAHMPDGSQELAAAADLPLTLDGCTLPLHSQVLAAGSRVLRTSLYGTKGAASSSGGECSSGGEGGGSLDPTAAAAVQRAFEGHSLQDAQQFLKFLYSPVAVADTPATLEAFSAVIRLADKLDAPAVLKACDWHLARSAAGDWLDWLRLADACGLPHLLRAAAHNLLAATLRAIGGSAAQEKKINSILAQCDGLRVETYRMLLHAMLHAAIGSGLSQSLASYVPSLANWELTPGPGK